MNKMLVVLLSSALILTGCYKSKSNAVKAVEKSRVATCKTEKTCESKGYPAHKADKELMVDRKVETKKTTVTTKKTK